nr:MAG TPA: hypothetical protein [Bacteriophage sp.]
MTYMLSRLGSLDLCLMVYLLKAPMSLLVTTVPQYVVQ